MVPVTEMPAACLSRVPLSAGLIVVVGVDIFVLPW